MLPSKELLYDWDGWNVSLFHKLNSIADPAYTQFMVFGTSLGKYTLFQLYLALLFGAVCVCGKQLKRRDFARYADFRSKWTEAFAVLITAYLLDLLWVAPLKNFFHYARPFAGLPAGSVNVPAIVIHSETPMSSFPSGHTTFAMMMVAGLWPALNAPCKAVAAIYLVWVSFSRIALGAHYPADVIYTLALSFIAVAFSRWLVGIICRQVGFSVIERTEKM